MFLLQSGLHYLIDMKTIYDVIVIGAGAMGSAASYHLSKTENKILIIDQYHPPHNLGSSHGKSRIIREAYFENPFYVPLVQQAYKFWQELEQESGEKLFLKTGGLMLGNKESMVVAGSVMSAGEYKIKHELLDGISLKQKFPILKPLPGTVALYDENAGILFPEACVQAHLSLAKKNPNTHFHFNETVQEIQPANEEVTIITNKSIYTAATVIISAGAWISKLLPDMHLPLTINRQVLHWFYCVDKQKTVFNKLLPQHFPIYIWEYEKGKSFYGFPDLGEGIKIAFHHGGQRTTAATIERSVSQTEIDEMHAIIDRFFDIEVRYNYSAVCMYTNTPDENFIIDYHPGHPNIIIASPCSGHGFKFSSAIGNLLAEMCMQQRLSFDIRPFRINRF
jgi:sarcosine oxidase